MKLRNYVFAAVISLAGCGGEQGKSAQNYASQPKDVCGTLTFDLREYRVKRGETLIGLSDRLLREESSGYGQRIHFGNRFQLEFDSNRCHTHVSPTGVLCEINGFGDACNSYYFEAAKLRVGQRLAVPDFNRDNQTDGKDSKKIGELEISISPSTDQRRILEDKYIYGSGHPRIDDAKIRRK